MHTAPPTPGGRPTSAMLLGDYLDCWLAEKRRTVSRQTAVNYGFDLAHARAALGGVRLIDITPIMVQEMVAAVVAGRTTGHPAAPRSVRTIMAVFAASLTHAVKIGVIPSNPARGVDLPRVRREERPVLYADQIAALVKHLDAADPWPPVNAILTVILGTGMRVGEAMGLRVGDVDLYDAPRPDGLAGLVRVRGQAVLEAGQWRHVRPKSDAGMRDIPLAAPIADAVRRRLALFGAPAPDGYALGRTLSQPYRQKVIREAFRRECKAAGVTWIKPHGGRRSFATVAAQVMTIEDLRILLGHESDAATLQYVQGNPAARQAAVVGLFAR